MYNPLSTYRIQFNKDFTFRQFLKRIDYFSLLGTGSIYASPVFAAAPGSSHGYDITDPHRFNPEIGSNTEFEAIVNSLGKLDIGWIQDIVPNHMALNYENRWLMDVLEYGKKSEYAGYFDIDFDHPVFKDKLALPFLDMSSEEAIEHGELRLSFKYGRFVFDYFGSFFPVNDESIRIAKEDINDNQAAVIVNTVNADRSRLKKLLADQHYVLVHWQEADVNLNYRRFFTISSLISLQMDDDIVFQNYHSFIAKLIENNMIRGLRIDHIDGLRKPSEYVDKLRSLTGNETYIIAEKIMQRNEELPSLWPVQGSTGYDFLAIVNNLFTYKKNYPALNTFYRQITGIVEEPEEIVFQKKNLILAQGMQADLDNLCRLFMELDFVRKDDPEITSESIREAIGEFLVACQKYKLYSDFFPLSGEDRSVIEAIIIRALERKPLLLKEFEILQNLFLHPESFREDEQRRALNFFLRCMLYTGPLMAKGQEDTAMYFYNCFIAHNEVGDSLDASGITSAEFHELMRQRRRKTLMSINSTSTHDTKRGEDVRARLAVISEIPDDWIKNVNMWISLNSKLKIRINDKDAPDINEEYFIYQTLVGIIPYRGQPDSMLISRLNEYIVKALREGKTNSSWSDPDENYEKAVMDFAGILLSPGSIFLRLFMPFQQKIAQYGILNSLSQLTIKSTCPGIPDFYQGTELWDLSLVDPDNRRQVDYDKLEKTLRILTETEPQKREELLLNLFSNQETGDIKLWFTHLLLKERRSSGDLFIYGEYIPLRVEGRFREHILAFSRAYMGKWYIVIIPLYTAMLTWNEDAEVIRWYDTYIELPDLAPDEWISVFDNVPVSTEGYIDVSELMKLPLPYVLKGDSGDNKRKSGILLHISSLPGSYGTGDIGPEAYNFIDFLSNAGQTYWQILPVNPVTAKDSFSPYSTWSAFAGNLLLTDPEWLLKYRLISDSDLSSQQFSPSDKADFEKAEEFRLSLLDKAYSSFLKHTNIWLRSEFKGFCDKEKFWLDDYVLYMNLRRDFGKPWYNWPQKIRDRDDAELNYYRNKYEEGSEKLKFFQFVFFMQWKALRDYANKKNIMIIGDMSFYVGYDSVDVWQNPEVFKLDKNKRMLASGGAPPDYFSKTGQLWNMPVYNWGHLKKSDFSWWINRIARNLEWFDLLRFDHFRGFSAYWEVPAGEQDAINGSWIQAPGNEFFRVVRNKFPEMPFIAEDLGEIDDKVYELRDNLGLPGMRVLQFAFNEAYGKSIHLPHNYVINSIVYTGTHDNNTTRGWYEKELPTKFKIWVDDYIDKKHNGSGITEEFIRLAFASVSFLAIIPIQDLLGLGPGERFNDPAGNEDNWKWKLKSMERVQEKAKYLRKLVKIYTRV